MTVASWIPGLGSIFKSSRVDQLRDFWCTDFIHEIWASPASIRAFLSRSSERVSCDPVPPHEDLRGVAASGSDYPWLDAAEILLQVKDIKEFGFSPNLMKTISAAPLYRGEAIVTVLCSKRLSQQIIGLLQQTLRTAATVFQVRGDEASIAQLLERTETDHIDPNRIFQKGVKKPDVKVTHELTKPGADLETEAVRVVSTCLLKAVKMRASDIIFAETPESLRVRYKVDGDWTEEPGGLPVAYAKEVINHIKMKSRLDISVVKVPQDGHLIKVLDRHRYIFRVNTSLDITGQKAVLRIQQEFDSIRTLEEYGMSTTYTDAIDQTLAGSTGLIVLSGPTGCGKSTTIYSIIRRIDPIARNVLTAESPVEIIFPNIFQTYIDERAGGETWASWSWGLLRKAPCIAVVGEMRDPDTVEAVMHVSSSGHRIISTLHTNSAWGIPARLMDLRAERFYISQALRVGIAQRLVKNLCPKCQIKVPVPTNDKLVRMGLDPEAFAGVDSLAAARGCPYCHGRGTYGRHALFEAMLVDDEIREAIDQGATSLDLKKISVNRGERTIFEKAIAEALLGRISLHEACTTRSS